MGYGLKDLRNLINIHVHKDFYSTIIKLYLITHKNCQSINNVDSLKLNINSDKYTHQQQISYVAKHFASISAVRYYRQYLIIKKCLKMFKFNKHYVNNNSQQSPSVL